MAGQNSKHMSDSNVSFGYLKAAYNLICKFNTGDYSFWKGGYPEDDGS
jgi:hypothetical protein